MKIDMQQLAAEAQVKTMQLVPPPIPFEESKKLSCENGRQQSTEDDNSTKYITFDCHPDRPQDKNSEKVSQKLKVFKNGTSEEYCKWHIDYDDLVTYPSFQNKAEAKFSLLFLSILKEHATLPPITPNSNVEKEIKRKRLV